MVRGWLQTPSNPRLTLGCCFPILSVWHFLPGGPASERGKVKDGHPSSTERLTLQFVFSHSVTGSLPGLGTCYIWLHKRLGNVLYSRRTSIQLNNIKGLTSKKRRRPEKEEQPAVPACKLHCVVGSPLFLSLFPGPRKLPSPVFCRRQDSDTGSDQRVCGMDFTSESKHIRSTTQLSMLSSPDCGSAWKGEVPKAQAARASTASHRGQLPWGCHVLQSTLCDQELHRSIKP